MHNSLSKFEGQRVLWAQGDIQLTSQNEVALRIVLRNPIQDRSGAKRITRIQRDPDSIVERIADVPFNSRQCFLAQNFNSTVGRVVRVKENVAVDVEFPFPVSAKWVVERNFRFKRPAVGTQI